ncbi:hypothetical protein ABBQ38_002448 [Trebouxia sp. C0009 RCD-2024]
MSGTIYNPIRGLYTKQAFGKFLHKGEDAWLQQPGLTWKPCPDAQGCCIGYDLFGVFDGHGGKQAAGFASKHVLPILQEELAGVDVKPDAALPEVLCEYTQLSDDDKLAWRMQDAMVQCLPAALVSTFKKVQDQFHAHTQVSGSTATVAVIVGWDLLVASVGDSEAYLDTGAEVIQVSDTHRLDDNKAEKKRCEDAGYEVCRSTVDGKPVGPVRVWPGGLAMSRTLGDHMAGEVVLPEPEVRRIALPSKGARLIIASDGLWDALNPKTAVHHVRGMAAGKAAGELVQAALKSKGLRDDITILVIDAMPDDSCRLPPHLAKPNGGHAPSVEEVGSVDWHKPLTGAAVAETCASNTWQRRIAAVQAEFGLPGQNSNGSSDTNVDDLQLDQSHLAGDSSACSTPFASPEAFLGEALLEEDSADWETVPVKPKREAAALPSASAPPSATDAPDGWAESSTAEDTAGQWEIPHKHTKLGSYQPNSSPAIGNGIKAMRDSQKQRGSDGATGSADEGRQQRGGRGRGRGQHRGRGRGRNYSKGHRNQQEQAPQVQGDDSSSATGQRSSPEGDVASSWGADTVFPMTPSPVDSPLLRGAGAAASVPRVLTIPRPPQNKSMTTGGGGLGHPSQQQSRGRRDNRARGGNNGRGGRGRRSGPADRVQSCPVYDISDQPACQQISFGNFGAEFGSTLQGSTTNPAAANNSTSSNGSHVYQEQHEHVSRQQPQGGVYRGRGRGRFIARGRSASNKTARQDPNQNNSAAVA